jgi:hypothetical protein
MNTDKNMPPDSDDLPEAVRRAETGAMAWRAVARAQRSAPPVHAEFYALAAEVDATLRALEDLARVLALQVAGYGVGRPVYDDAPEIDPRERLRFAAASLGGLAELLAEAQQPAQAFFSAIGHIGVEVNR